MVLPSAYLPPVSWFSSLVKGEPVMVEQYENYHKQTIRNRCTIDSPNGPLNLSIPIDRSNFVEGKCLMKDVRISTHNDWQRQHWYALETSYFNSPFFEYLQDDFRPLYEQQWTFLIDFNEALISTTDKDPVPFSTIPRQLSPECVFSMCGELFSPGPLPLRKKLPRESDVTVEKALKCQSSSV